jgi:phosphoribosylformylglycinamidine synthase
VQRGNPEMQRRAQEVIDRCWALGEDNPIELIHDVGAGGLSNAVPEAVAHSASRRAHRPARGAERRARHVAAGDLVQRGAGALRAGAAPERLPRFAAIAQRERCPYTRSSARPRRWRAGGRDPLLGNDAVHMPIEALLGKPPQMRRDVRSVPPPPAAAASSRTWTCARRYIACCGSRRWRTRHS